jgi:hypothetical protein
MHKILLLIAAVVAVWAYVSWRGQQRLEAWTVRVPLTLFLSDLEHNLGIRFGRDMPILVRGEGDARSDTYNWLLLSEGEIDITEPDLVCRAPDDLVDSVVATARAHARGAGIKGKLRGGPIEAVIKTADGPGGQYRIEAVRTERGYWLLGSYIGNFSQE